MKVVPNKDWAMHLQARQHLNAKMGGKKGIQHKKGNQANKYVSILEYVQAYGSTEYSVEWKFLLL